MRIGEILLLLTLTLGACTSAAKVPEAADTGSATSSATALAGTHWAITELGGKPVDTGALANEPYLQLIPAEGRVVGSAGCNSFGGSVRIEGERIGFGALAGTRMMCSKGMDTERRIHVAFANVQAWRISGSHLELFDADGQVLIRLQARQSQ